MKSQLFCACLGVAVGFAVAAEYASQDTYAVTTRSGACDESWSKWDDGYEKTVFGRLNNAHLLNCYINNPSDYDTEYSSFEFTTTWNTTTLPSSYNGISSTTLTYGDFTLTITLASRATSGYECSCITRIENGERPCQITHFCDYHDFSAVGSGWSETVTGQSLASNKCFRTTVTKDGASQCMTMCVPRTLCTSCRFDLERPWVITAAFFMCLFFVFGVMSFFSIVGTFFSPLIILGGILLAITVAGLLEECDMQAGRECGYLCTILNTSPLDTWPVCTSF